jgi:homoserine kinase
MTSDIPLEHGLGSSSSAIIAGIQLADKLGNLHLSIDQKLRIACQLEGHPDNVAPALLGGLVVASYSKRQLSYQKLMMPECAIVATVPAYNVSTEKARALLSKTFSRRKAVIASSRANVMVAALANGDLSAAGEQMEQDLFHEPYRRALIPELEKIRELGHIHGAYASYLSGAGSTVVTLLDNSATVSFIEAAKPFGQVLSLSVDKKGAKYE